MGSKCTPAARPLRGPAKRDFLLHFDGGAITSDAGAPLLAAVARKLGLLPRLARCFKDFRDPGRVRHTLQQLLAQRLYGIALAYEDLVDHDHVGSDALFAAVVGKADPHGHKDDRFKRPLAASATMQRLDMSAEAGLDDRYRRIKSDGEALRNLFVDLFLDRPGGVPDEIVIDLDTTDVTIHGEQEGRYYHGHYRDYCYLPLFAFCGEDILLAELRTADIGAGRDIPKLLGPVIKRILEKHPNLSIVLRGDSAFSTDETMSWCEEIGVGYIFGLSRNSRLESELKEELSQARAKFEETGEPARVFKDFRYRTLDSWSCDRRVVGKAEHLQKGANPRFVVTNIAKDDCCGQVLYEDRYCARGEAENRIKEQQLYLFGDRLSNRTMQGNQLRLWFSSLAYTLLVGVRRLVLKSTKAERSRADTIRTRFLKVGAWVKVTARRVLIHASSAYPWKEELISAWKSLANEKQLC